MKAYFTVNIKYEKPKEDGDGYKKANEKYLVRADSVTEAEARMHEWLPNNYREVNIDNATLFDLDEIIKERDSEEWYLGRVAYPIPTKSGSTKWHSFQVMANGNDIEHAMEDIKEKYKEGTQDYVLRSIALSQIIVDDDLAEISE